MTEEEEEEAMASIGLRQLLLASPTSEGSVIVVVRGRRQEDEAIRGTLQEHLSFL